MGKIKIGPTKHSTIIQRTSPTVAIDNEPVAQVTASPTIIEKIVEVPVEVIKHVYVDVVKEIEKIVHVPIETIKHIEVPVETIKEIIKEVPVEVIKFETKIVEKEVEVIKEIEKFVELKILSVPKWTWALIGFESLVILGLLIFK